MAIAAPGIKVNVTLRVVPATEPALTMVRFKPLSEAQSFEARVISMRAHPRLIREETRNAMEFAFSETCRSQWRHAVMPSYR
jgi:hypothetical protein